MALSFDDKLLGEKVENYCSSSEDEREEDSPNEEDDKAIERNNFMKEKQAQMPPPMSNKHQTGPKGVIEDWKQYKELASLKKLEEQLELTNFCKNISGNCKTNAELDRLNKEDEEFKELLEGIEGAEEILAEFHEKRMNEMRKIYLNLPKYDSVYELDTDTFSSTIDNEHQSITIIIHLYEPSVQACQAVRGCFSCLALEYPHVRFCNMRASKAKMSQNFLEKGLPALIVYKGGELIGNLIKIDQYLGDDFYSEDIENFLQEYGFIPDKTTDLACKLSTVRVPGESTTKNDDYDID